MEKEKVIKAVARVQISVNNFWVDDRNFVRFTVQSRGRGLNLGDELFVFDHRPATRQPAIEMAFARQAPWKDPRRVKLTLAEAVKKPARVIVMKKSNQKRTFYYVNLFPTKEKPSALFSQTSYRGTDTGLTIREDQSFWSWTSQSSSPSNLCWKMILVALTDERRRIVIKGHGCFDISQTDKNLTVISNDIQQMTEEKLLADFKM